MRSIWEYILPTANPWIDGKLTLQAQIIEPLVLKLVRTAREGPTATPHTVTHYKHPTRDSF